MPDNQHSNEAIYNYNDEVRLRNYKREKARERAQQRKARLIKFGQGIKSGIQKASAQYKENQHKQTKKIATKTKSNFVGRQSAASGLLKNKIKKSGRPMLQNPFRF